MIDVLFSIFLKGFFGQIMVINLISVSGGKDSTAMILLALEMGVENPIFIFSDTGHEHAETYDYLGYLERTLEIKIVRVKADFTARIAAKRKFIANDQRVGRKYETINVPVKGVFDDDGKQIYRKKKVGGGKRVRWSNKAKRRALEILHPTGNPFLDLCLWKGRFPSTKARFCSTELKHGPLNEYAMQLMAGGNTVISWQGVRADESENRKDLAEKDVEFGSWEPEPKGLLIYRPLITWVIDDVFAIHEKYHIKPNPLYRQGMGRVGCMPCIHARKDELRNIAMRFPEEINRVREWESLVGRASKHNAASFFAHADNRGQNIIECVEWSKTSRGGKNYDLINAIEESSAPACASIYGLCDKYEIGIFQYG